MSVTPSTLPRGLRRAQQSRAQRWAGHRAQLSLAVTAGVLLNGVLAVAAVTGWRTQTSQAASARELVAARSDLDRALDRARAAGLTAAELGPVGEDERRILAEPELPNTLWLVDAGEADHRTQQAAALRALPVRVEAAIAGATARDRRRAMPVLDDFEAAVAAAGQAGLDVSDDERRAARARRALGAARTPAAVALATRSLAGRSGELRQLTADKIAADAAAVELSSRHDQAEAALGRVQDLLTKASAFPQLQLDGVRAQIASLQAAFGAATTPREYQGVTTRARGVAADLSSLLKARADAYQDLDAAHQTLQQATQANLDVGTVPAQLTAISSQLDAAGTTDQFRSLTAQIDSLMNPVADRLIIQELGPGKAILISLDKQTLTAYQDGQVFLTTLVTTGRPALPTPPGTTTVSSKNHPWHMVSDWPADSPYWYPPSDVTYVLWFRCCGYGIHDAPWRSTYGPGTEAHGSHGCVNVPLAKMSALYDWADVGTRVVVR